MMESHDDMEATIKVVGTNFSTLNLNESWVELGTGESTMVSTVRITENFASNTEKQYLAELEKELSKPDPIADLQKEQKIADTLAKLVTLADVAETANNCLGRFIREKLRTTDLVSNIADQLYDHFTMTTGADRKLSMAGLKTLITEIQLDPYVAMTREVKLAFRLIESLIPRIIGSIAKSNVEDSMELMALILRRFGLLTRTHREFKNVHLWQDYFCTGVVLGKGAYATVFLGRHVKTAKVVAIKTMDWDNLTRGKPKQEASLTNEIEIMRASDHPNIVRLYDVVREGCMIHLVMEYCGGGTLEDFIKTQGPLPEDESRHFVRQLALGLKFLRDKGIIHRDLKPENLLLSSDQGTASLKIADFTFARFIEPGDLATTLVGSPLYMAPEIFLNHRYSEKADLWSVGAIVFKMLTGQPPYPSSSLGELIHLLQTRAPKMPDNLSADMKDLLCSLLERNPDLRISWTEFFLHKCLNLNTLGQSSVANQLTDSEQLLVKDHELSEIRKEMEGLKAANDRVQQEVSVMEKKLREAAQREKKLEEENAVLMGELAQLKDGNDSKKKDGDNWLKLIAREQQISAELEGESRHWQEVAETKERELVQLREELEQYKAREEESQTREAQANAEKQMNHAEIVELRSAAVSISEERDLYKEEAEAAKKQLEELRRELAKATSAGRKDEAEEALEQERRVLAMRREEIEALHAVAEMQFREERCEKDAVISAQQETIKKMEETVEQLKQEHDVLTNEIAAYKLILDEEVKNHGKGRRG